jgi:hypothetical protein
MGRFNEDLTALTYRVRLLRMGNFGAGATAGVVVQKDMQK